MLNDKFHPDVFLGSNTTSKAIQIHDHIVIGFELNPKYEDIIKNRLDE